MNGKVSVGVCVWGWVCLFVRTVCDNSSDYFVYINCYCTPAFALKSNKENEIEMCCARLVGMGCCVFCSVAVLAML